MSDWEKCPNLQECTEGNRFGKGCVEDPVQNAMGGKPWHVCHCGVDSDGNPPNRRQADEITRLRAEVERLRAALKWALPLAELSIDTSRVKDAIERAREALTNAQKEELK